MQSSNYQEFTFTYQFPYKFANISGQTKAMRMFLQKDSLVQNRIFAK
ncbi:hypothetical protein [Nostoc sp. FACHB-110]|nr:hypothetical protein [Nostoc sp. FACHB-110]MBD2441282.1 hypothetical protein [Nostoc sp. FACHB-110]